VTALGIDDDADELGLAFLLKPHRALVQALDHADAHARGAGV
jgi:hypothetical protein